jgi:hypothetical protein
VKRYPVGSRDGRKRDVCPKCTSPFCPQARTGFNRKEDVIWKGAR